ncbi:MAG TPA: transposase [Candidatus Acidoferrum sp.]|jgi:transposase|nr:transposase [Candidatus Acidoferrum sp.]
MKIATYDTNLTDAQWDYLKPMLPQPAKFGRPPKDGRRLIDASLYLVKCGCPWRYPPADFPPWQTVYHVFRCWTLNHQWAAPNDALRTLVRQARDKHDQPTAAVLDSQSVKSADWLDYSPIMNCQTVSKHDGQPDGR